MQKGTPYPWLMRLSLSVAIALPSTHALWLATPANASEELRSHQSATAAPVAAEASDEAAAIAKSPVLKPEPTDVAAQFAAAPSAAPLTARHTHQASRGTVQPRQMPAPVADAEIEAPVAQAATPIVAARAETAAAPAPQVVNTVLPKITTPQFEALFSQVEPGPDVEVGEPETPVLEGVEGESGPDVEVEEPETPILDELEGEAEPLPESVLEETPETPVLDELESDDDADLGTPDPALEETAPDPAILDETVPDAGGVTESGEDVFSPLPATEGDGSTDAEDDTTEVELEDLGQPEPDAPPSAPPGAPVLIPAERLLDDLEYLNPDPNPLLIQTVPEEVEIIGNQPLTLEEAVELAYRNNPDLRVVLLELEQSRAALREAQAELYPTVSVNGNFQGRNTTDASTEVVQTPGGGLGFETNQTEELGFAYSAGVDVVYNVYSSGRRGAAIRAAEEQLQLSELEVERRREELRLATASEYYDLQAAIEAIRISQAFLEEAERNLRDTALREEVGVGTRFDVLRAEVQVANARQDLVNSQRARQVAQRTLARRLNVPPSLTITTVPVDIAGTWPLDLEESIVLAFQNRAELEQQLTQREINEELRTAELAALGPQVDLFANYNISDTLTQENSFSDNYSLGARVSWTLYEGGAASARARQRELDIEIAERNFEEARNTIRLSVESAYYNLQANLTNIDTARLAVEQAQEALELAILRFDAGVGTQLDILNAQSELTDAEVNLVQAIVGYNRSLAEINRAVSNLPEPYYEEIPY